MIILALDASTTAVGWAVFEDGDYRESGVYVPKHDDWWLRVRHIGLWLDGKLNGSLYHGAYPGPVVRVAYEIATGNRGNMRTNRLLGAVEYEVRCAVRRYSLQVPFLEVTASQVRATQCHKENLPNAVSIKGAPLHKTKKLAGDEADAIGVGLAAWGKIKKEQWEALGQENQ